MNQKDSHILNLIKHSRLKLDNIDFEQNCMQALNEQSQAAGNYSMYYKWAGRFNLAAIAVCLAIICLSLLETHQDIMNLIFLQSLAIAVLCCLILRIKNHWVNLL